MMKKNAMEEVTVETTVKENYTPEKPKKVFNFKKKEKKEPRPFILLKDILDEKSRAEIEKIAK